VDVKLAASSSCLLGLSMDYHVFLLLGIREKFQQTGNNRIGGFRPAPTGCYRCSLDHGGSFRGLRSGDMTMSADGLWSGNGCIRGCLLARSVLSWPMKILGKYNWY
jgi:uncharacterized membrane protein YdfJ with MMPL/SSD domain